GCRRSWQTPTRPQGRTASHRTNYVHSLDSKPERVLRAFRRHVVNPALLSVPGTARRLSIDLLPRIHAPNGIESSLPDFLVSPRIERSGHCPKPGLAVRAVRRQEVPCRRLTGSCWKGSHRIQPYSWMHTLRPCHPSETSCRWYSSWSRSAGICQTQ